MNYQHLFHAGNFADVFKHVALTLMLRALHKKDTPFCYIDTHAGAGRYDLTAPAAQRSGEYAGGIARLWDEKAPALADYLEAVREHNPDGRLRFYPGSPLIARRLLRAQDQMILCEKHPEQYAQLKLECAGDTRIALHQRDGYELLKALLPPPARRGVVLIDPPYEQADEFDRILAGLVAARERWATGIYAVWYPIKDRKAVTRLHAATQAGDWRKVLVAELVVYPEDTAFRLNGCGLLIVNPPWGLDEALGAILTLLRDRLGTAAAPPGTVTWLVEE
jgi:23S rRNA (adenine2030-N6)-methyltransferase